MLSHLNIKWRTVVGGKPSINTDRKISTDSRVSIAHRERKWVKHSDSLSQFERKKSISVNMENNEHKSRLLILLGGCLIRGAHQANRLWLSDRSSCITRPCNSFHTPSEQAGLFVSLKICLYLKSRYRHTVVPPSSTIYMLCCIQTVLTSFINFYTMGAIFCNYLIYLKSLRYVAFHRRSSVIDLHFCAWFH